VNYWRDILFDLDTRLSAPWVASIFLKNPSNGLWELICGGTITSSYTIITSIHSSIIELVYSNIILSSLKLVVVRYICIGYRCLNPRVAGEKFSTRPYQYNYGNLKVVAGLKSSSFDDKDEFTQYRDVGQIRDLFGGSGANGDSPYKDLAAIRLKDPFKLTSHVKDVVLTEQVGTILEANATKAGSQVLIAGFDQSYTSRSSSGGGVQTRSKSTLPLKMYELKLTDMSTCLDLYMQSYSQAHYFDVLCGLSVDNKTPVPCHLEGSGMIVKASIKTRNDPKPLENFYLFGVYSSNSAVAVTEGSLIQNNRLVTPPCTPQDSVFFTQLGYLGRWGISHNFCDAGLAMCRNDKCRPWSDLCNGKFECEDGSDELPSSCFNQVCASNEFKCKYGGCIQKSLACNGVPECTDGSDEDVSSVCKDKMTSTNPRKTITCEGIPESPGVTVTCIHPDTKKQIPCGANNNNNLPVGTGAVLQRAEVRATCTANGIWSQNVNLSKCP